MIMEVMKAVLLGKIDRNPERIETWEWCKLMVKSDPNEWRIKYEFGDFYLERKMKSQVGTLWLRTVISGPEK